MKYSLFTTEIIKHIMGEFGRFPMKEDALRLLDTFDTLKECEEYQEKWSKTYRGRTIIIPTY